MASHPRYRDACIIMLIGAAIGVVLGIDILVRALDGPSEAKGAIAWSALLIAGAAVLAVQGLRMLRRKGP